MSATLDNGGFERVGHEIWTVFDLNARNPKEPRVHEMADGTLYPLLASKGTEMPRHHAAVFLKDPAFRVVNAAGRVIPSLPAAEAERRRNDDLNLAPDQSIARYDELTDAALLARVAARPGGTDVALDADRAAMIAFLTTAPRIAELARAERVRDTSTPETADGETEPMSDADTLAMLRGGGSVGARDPLAMGG